MTATRMRSQPSQKKECNEMNDHTPLSIWATMDPRVRLTLNAQINSLPAITLMDSKATGMFMHPTYAHACHAKIQFKVLPREVQVISSGLITQEATVEQCVGDHREIVIADLTNTGCYRYILETLWFVCHDPTIQWAKREVFFNSSYCHENCLGCKSNHCQITIKEMTPQAAGLEDKLQVQSLEDFVAQEVRLRQMEGLVGMGDAGCDHPGVPKSSSYQKKKVILKYAMVSMATF